MSKMGGMPTVLERRKNNPSQVYMGVVESPPPPLSDNLFSNIIIEYFFYYYYVTIMFFQFSTEDWLSVVQVRRLVELMMVC